MEVVSREEIPDTHPWEDDDPVWMYSHFSYSGYSSNDMTPVAYPVHSEDQCYIYKSKRGFVIKEELDSKRAGVKGDKSVAGPFKTLEDAKAYYMLVFYEEET